MSKTTKKQSLLGKTPQQAKARSHTQRPRPTRQPNNNHKAAPAAANQPATAQSKRGVLIASLLLLLLLISFPKPTLLTYKKLDMVSESIFWPGLFGYGTTLVDSNLRPKLDKQRKALYLCIDANNLKSCQKYQIVADNGLFSAIKAFFIH
ncbi:hypothetical protein [Pseudoalteromonas sp.]|uniref:hypothetical protein n=1 Tax=Pseudoalteromonas sp. TaxID=53249 RepID=UPI003562E9C4